MSYRCAICGQEHGGLPDVVMDRPDMWWDVPEDERDRRITCTTDTCIIDNEDFFIRGVIEVPIHDFSRAFGFGVWVSQKRENFETYVQNFDSAEIGPFFGWLCNRITFYKEDSLFLKTMAKFRGQEARPRIELEPIDHPLAVDQREGISLDKAWEIAHFYFPKADAA